MPHIREVVDVQGRPRQHVPHEFVVEGRPRQHMPLIRQGLDFGSNRTKIREEYPSPREWPEPNVLGRLDQLGIQPRFWNPWISMFI